MLVVVGSPFILGLFSWISLSVSFQIPPPNYASVADATTLLIILHSTRKGQFLGGIDLIGVLDFGPRKKYPPALLCDSGSEL